MKRITLFFLLFFASYLVFSQSKVEIQLTSVSLDKVILKIEKKFDVKYSYVDSVIVNKTITLPKNMYSLVEINAEVTKQTKLIITKISSRYFSISSDELNEDSETIRLQEVLVESFLINGIKKDNQKFILSPQKSEILAGVTDTDVLLSLQQLPGVKSPNETATGLYVRGGTPDQNLVLLDGIRLFHPGHLFGMISGINSLIAKKVNFYNKGVSPKFGERISSVIDIETPNELVEKTTTIVGANAINIDAFTQIPIVKNKLDIQLSGRKSYTEFLQSYTFNQFANKVFQNTDFKSFDDKNKFQFYDYSAKLIYKASENSVFSLTGLSINNNLNYNYIVAKDSILNQEMKILSDGYSLNWQKKYSNKFSHKFLAYYSIYDFKYLKRQDYALQNNFEAFKKLNRIVNSGAEFNFNSVINTKINLEYGYQVSGNDVSHLFNTYNQDFALDLNLRQLYAITHSGYLNFNFFNKMWDIQTGIRHNYFTTINYQGFEPRVFVQKKIMDCLVFQVSYERKNQNLNQVRENAANDLSLENYIWVLSDNEKYPIQKGNQFSAGLLFKKKNWLIDLDTYYKTIDGITSVDLGFFSQTENQTNRGEGFTKGLDVFIQKRVNNWRTSITYSYQDSQNKFTGLNNDDYFKSNANITHAVNFTFNKKWNRFSTALGWFWHTGKPYNIVDNNGQIISYNENNLPSYHRMDVSVDYNFSKNKIDFKTGISFYNLYNRKSLLSREYERKYNGFSDFTNPRYEKQDFYSLGFTPNIFVRISF